MKELKVSDVGIMDDLTTRAACVRHAFEEVEALITYLAPYSPCFNPIEEAFVKSKAVLRKAAARTISDRHRALTEALEAMNSVKRSSSFTACEWELE